MKIKNYLVMVLVALCAIACSDNDDEISVSTGVTGSYDGYVIASCAYFQNSASDGQTVVITASGTAGDRVNISYVSDTWGTFTFTDAAVTLNGGVYTIAGSGTTEMGHAGNISTYDCTVEATLDSNKAITSLVFSIPTVMGGTTVTFVQGDMPVAYVVAGSYSGYALASCAYFKDMSADGQTVTIAAGTAGDKVNISYVSDTWGTFTFTDAAVTLNGGVYTIAGSGTTQMGHAGSTSTYDCTVAATLDSDKAITSLVFSVPSVMGGMTVTFIQGDMPVALAIAGSYSGTLDLTVAGNPAGSIDSEKVTVAAAEDGTVTMTLAGFSVGTMALGDVTVTGVAVTAEDNGTYTLSGEVNAQVAMGESTINVTGTVEGTITSAGVANLTFVLTPGAMPMPITAVFTTAVAE